MLHRGGDVIPEARTESSPSLPELWLEPLPESGSPARFDENGLDDHSDILRSLRLPARLIHS
jgi:hypothetical protein